MAGLVVDGRGLIAGTSPGGSGRQSEGAAGEAREARFIRVARRQRDFDAGDLLRDASGDLDQRQADGVELGIAPEGGLGREAAQGVQEPVGGGVDQQTELVCGCLGARRSV
jgi:hypothetical protein